MKTRRQKAIEVLLIIKVMALTTLFLMLSYDAKAYVDAQCVDICLSSSRTYETCSKRCETESQRPTALQEAQSAYDRQQRDFDQTMRMRDANSSGKSAFDLVNGGR